MLVNTENSVDANWVPLSIIKVSGFLNLAKVLFSSLITAHYGAEVRYSMRHCHTYSYCLVI